MIVLGIIPARSGSKGIKDKNIKKINNKTLIEIAYQAAKKSKIFTHIIISTDSLKYKKILKKSKINIDSLRPKKYSMDNTTDLELLNYEINKFENYIKKKINYVALLQPTSPFRSAKDLIKCFHLIKSKKFDAVWTITKIDKKFNPIKVLNIKKNNLKYSSNNGSTFASRQKLSESYIRNGIAYFFSRKSIMVLKKILPLKSGFLEIKKKLFNIDTIEDLKETIKLLSKKK